MLARVSHTGGETTLTRQIIRQTVLRAVETNKQLVHVVDQFAQAAVRDSLPEFGFFETDEGWMKMNVLQCGSAEEIAALVAGMRHECVEDEGIDELANRVREVDSAESVAYYEQWLWPGKVCSGHLPTYIIPIQPCWAADLIDESLASRRLFGRAERLALNVEGVYYRSARLRLKAPARILWYVSSDEDQQVSSIRACSALVAAEIGLPKDLYRTYKRLGVYRWEQVYETAGKDAGKKIMAVRFSGTELLSKVVRYDALKAMLRDEFGVKTNFEGPTRIPESAFLKIYRMARR